ncbi:extracellular solute-binding protein [Bradyrhizobium sp. CSA112]|uniref:ABC transporter substrate-binding protein n=1 Tax=Bradyrhizobium sp. CSA112 TaxID=2699170 RepID=UPI0023B0FD06|nr:extracellular solute-binding protein [Bradyrhizobium sp. CSA112]MDE5458803.1 extracellular solute-binding protein [Bradyrhizobium sp. CSA112]
MELKRREFLQGVGALGVAATSLPLVPKAHAKEQLTAYEFGPPWVNASKKVAAKWDKADITWELSSGGGATLLAKIKATWPNSPYDLVNNWSPVFKAMIKEGWAETVTLADVPNLADVPERLLTRDDKGNIKNIPREVDGGFFAVRADRCPIEIKTIEDLLNPKLKGQICWPTATNFTCAPLVMLALARGGNEFNLDPGWKFLEELAKSGNIGRVFKGVSEATNSLSTGETSIVYAANGALSALAKRMPMKALTKSDPSLKAILYTQGWVVMANSKKKKAAMEFANFTVSKENCELFFQDVSSIPANQKVKPNEDTAAIHFTEQEFNKFAYLPDYGYMSTQLDSWVKKFEQDITPKI